MAFFIISMLNGVSYGLLLFMLSAGFTLIYSMMGVLNFAHAAFYMLGAYVGYSLSTVMGFWPALLVAPVLVGILGAGFERYCLRQVHASGHAAELMITFGLAYVIHEMVPLIWGRTPLEFVPPDMLRGALLTWIDHPLEGLRVMWGDAPKGLCGSVVAMGKVVCSPFPATRALMMVVALGMLILLWLLLTRTRVGLVIQAALTHPQMVEALGHNVPRVFMLVFGVGTAMAGLAGVIGGSIFLTDPGMDGSVGSIIFVVVVVGGLGSLRGAFLASLLIGVLESFAVATGGRLTQIAPVLPYLLLVLLLIFKPTGLLGRQENAFGSEGSR